jgi:site-specific DNA-methyltransferase (adenine-specific)
MITLVSGDAIYEMKKIANDSIDCIITSPPYDSIRTYNGYCDFDFEKFKLVAIESLRVLKQGGCIVWIVADQTKNGSETGTSFRQALYFQSIGFNIHDTMIWSKNGFTDVASLRYRYAQTFEYMFVLSKGKLKTFNPIKDKPNKWKGTRVHGTIRLPNGETKPKTNNKVLAEFGQRYNVWKYDSALSNNERTGHPAQFPVRLITDHVKSWTNENDVVLDMFMGSGTTGVVCKRLNRNFIGIELNPEYFEMAVDRINNKERKQNEQET